MFPARNGVFAQYLLERTGQSVAALCELLSCTRAALYHLNRPLYGLVPLDRLVRLNKIAKSNGSHVNELIEAHISVRTHLKLEVLSEEDRQDVLRLVYEKLIK